MTNRDQRRHPEKVENPPVSPQDQMRETDRPQDTLDPRAKNSGHGKKTADKWNQ
jgi:hypothetical protein